jgi:hypothetical protein
MTETIFRGKWPDDDDNDDIPDDWETFTIMLHGREVGDFIDNPKEVVETLAKAGLKIVKISHKSVTK